MSLQIKPESTTTRIAREPSTPRSTRPGEEVNRIWPRPEPVEVLQWTLDVPDSQSPPDTALLNVAMMFGGGVVRMEAVDIGISVQGDKAPNVYVRLIDAVRKYLETSRDERTELLNYTPDTWFRFVPPDQAPHLAHEEPENEDEEFVRHLKRYHRRRFSDEW